MPLIMHLRASNFLGGPEKQIIGHLKTSRNFRQMVLTFNDNGASKPFVDKCRLEGIAVDVISGTSAYSLSSIISLHKFFKYYRPSIVVTHGYRPAIISQLIKINSSIPIIMFARGHTGENLKVSLFENLERLCMQRSDKVVAVSQGYADFLKTAGIGRDRVRVVRNAAFVKSGDDISNADRSKLLNELKVPENVNIVVSAGRLSPEKGHRYLIDSIRRIQEYKHNTYFIICGEGPCRRDLEDQARRVGVYDQCRFTGFRNDIYHIFEIMDFMVLPSLSEGLPNVILEAFSTKKPVIATNVGGVAELVTNNENGFLIPSQRSDLLADSIKKLLSNPEAAKKMGNNGYIKVKQHFTFEIQTKILENIYEEIINKRSYYQD